MTRFSLIRVRSPLLTESLLFSLPVGTEMFHFPTFPPHTLYIQVQVTTWSCNRWRGSPIRTPSDQSLVINSPRLIADSYVLLRLLMPRHSPCALKNLTTHKRVKHNTPPPKRPCIMILCILIIERTMKTSTTPKGAASDPGSFIFSKKLLSYKRCSRSLCSSQTTTPTTHPTTRAPNNTTNTSRCIEPVRT